MPRYKRPAVTVDAILEKDGRIMFIRRGHDPYKEQLALPGGFVDYGEKVEDAVIREAKEEVGIDATIKALLGVYSDPHRDPRGHAISTVFICTFEGEPEAGDDADSYHWISINDLAENTFAFDHQQIIMDYIQWRKNAQTFWSSKSE